MNKLKILILILIFFYFHFISASFNYLKPNRFLETYLIKTPDNIVESNYVEFEFNGINLKNKKDNIYFQVKLLPFYPHWETIYSTKKYYYLPSGNYKAIFFVRSLNNKNEYDPTPISYIFQIKTSKFYKNITIYPSYDGFSLTLINNSNKKINITNWQIKTSLFSFKIPKAVKNYHPDPLLRKEEDIILEPNDKVLISAVYESKESMPFNLKKEEIRLSPLGINFLGNKCFNYLNKDFNLNYYVYFCDRINLNEEDLLKLVLKGEITRDCAQKIKNLGCGPLNDYEYQNLKSDLKCFIIVNSFYNYNSCYLRNFNKEDFFEKEWRIYIDTRNEIDKKNRKFLKPLFQTRFENIRLEDENGFLVNEYNFY
jgi:hypothetical protein